MIKKKCFEETNNIHAVQNEVGSITNFGLVKATTSVKWTKL